jgi:hypothetical protein
MRVKRPLKPDAGITLSSFGLVLRPPLTVSFIVVPSHHGLRDEGYGGELLIYMHTRTLHV